MDLTTKTQGAVTELKCFLKLTDAGFLVSQPIIDCGRYDCVVDTGKKLLRIQIKTSRWKNEETKEALIFNAYSQHATQTGNKRMKYSPEEIDYFMTEFNGEYFLVQCQCEEKEYVLRFIDNPRISDFDRRYIRWAKDYQFEKVIEEW